MIIVKFSALQKVKLNSPLTFAKQIFHTRQRISQQRYFTRRKANLTEKALPKKCFFLAGVAGFEPTNAAVKVLCLTA